MLIALLYTSTDYSTCSTTAVGQSQENESPSTLRKAFHLLIISLGCSIKVIQSVTHQLFPTEVGLEKKEFHNVEAITSVPFGHLYFLIVTN